MKRIFGALVAVSLAFSMVGCAEWRDRIQVGYQAVTSVAVTPREVVIAMSAYDVEAVLATNYQRGVRCDGSNGPICRDPAWRVRIDQAILSGRVARNNLKAYLKEHPGVTEIRLADYDTLKAATETLSQATATWRAAGR